VKGGIITRLRIGHTGLNHNLNLLGKHETVLSINCDRREMLEHILIECEAYRTERIVLLEQVKDLGTHLSVEGLFSFSTSKPSTWPAIIRYL